MFDFKIHKLESENIAELVSAGQVINDLSDAVDLIGNADYQGGRIVALQRNHLHPDFFDLKTGLAGEILQKFSTYSMRLAIIGDFSEVKSKSLRDFIYESNKYRKIVFVADLDEAKQLFGT